MELNKDTINKLRGLIIFTVIVVVAGVNYKNLLHLAGVIFNIISPFLVGAAIAFVLNVPMRWIEKMIKTKKEAKWKRPLALCLAIFGVTGILTLVVFVVIPQLLQTLKTLNSSIPVFLAGVQKEAEKLFANNPQILESISQIQFNWDEILSGFLNFLKVGAGSVLSTTMSAAMTIFNGITTVGIAFIFAVYILLQKETLGRQGTKLLQAYLPEKAVSYILKVAALTERIFSSFLTGQCVEAVILGSMFFLILNLLNLPYALLIGVLIAFTALIPVFGAFIGCAVGIFLMLMVNPMDAIIFTIVFFVLQQIEGNLIYPHVVGGSVGLPSIWVLVAVTVGGSAMGIVGMLIFIPMCSVLYSLLREDVNKKLVEKNKTGNAKKVKK